jgi:hypothetical protein
VLVVPPSRSGEIPPDDLELDTQDALAWAVEVAEFYGLSRVYVATSEAAPWNPDWGDLS